MATMMWWPITSHFHNFLATHEVCTNEEEPITVRITNLGVRPDTYPAIFIIPEASSGIDFHTKRTGTETLWMEFWTKNDSADPAEAYASQYAFEEKIYELFPLWARQAVLDLGLAPVVTVPRRKMAPEKLRPLCAGFALVQIDWKR